MGRKSKLHLRGLKAEAKKNIELTVEVEAPKAKIPVKSTGSSQFNLRVSPKTFKKFNEELATVFLPGKTSGSRRDIQDKKETIFGVEKRLVRVAVNKHANIIKQKFPEIDIKELVESVHLILQDTLNSRVKSTNGIEWFDNTRREIIAVNFRKLQDFMTLVKNDIRFKARKSIDESKSKTTTNKLVSTAIVIGGIDVRTKDQGGDLLPTDLKDGRIVKSKDLPANRRRELTSINKSRGIQIGHAFGPGIGNIAAFTDNTEIFDLFNPLEQVELLKLRKRAKKIDARTTIESTILKRTGRKIGQVTVVYIESTEGNTTEGAKLGRQIVSKLKKIITAKSRELLNYTSSLSLIQQHEQALIDALIGKKSKGGATRKTFKASKKGAENLALYGPKLQPSKSRRSNTRENTKSQYSSTSLTNILNLLNSKLHDKIKENMGKGGSKKILNYRTGRFARSAKIQTFFEVKEKGVVGAQVRYRKNPYKVFEPGGSRLATPGRDPAKIFGRSIRQLLQEEKIANLRRVKVTLRG